MCALFQAEQGFGGGWIELAEDGSGLPPGVARGVGVADAAVHLAELGEGPGFAVAVAKPPEEVDGGPVAGDGLGGDGLGVVAEVLVGVAEAVPRVGLIGAVVELLVQGQCLPAERQGRWWWPSRPWCQPTSLSAIACPTRSPAPSNRCRACCASSRASP